MLSDMVWEPIKENSPVFYIEHLQARHSLSKYQDHTYWRIRIIFMFILSSTRSLRVAAASTSPEKKFKVLISAPIGVTTKLSGATPL
uniref:Uncharacterized protein n=1 Tax=Tanacetum cinerariifolium TaxID=118510 RepID=A0A699H6L3_TANCI|nr:hypothetical protein [Tanacetum cinerariifolium]